ncbi:rubredoxin [Methanoregula sp.]|jgi:rubredoxin|uniref:rubredoxin n=1 Tax=Methanoregula sp. TaxID=2052170 RepID=UPI003C18BD99
MVRYVCSICGHVYNPEKGEPRQDIPLGIDFQELPVDFPYRVCFALKNEFCREG